MDRRSLRGKRLTPAEKRVIELVCEGLTNPQIAARLYVSPRTVQGHLLNVFQKLRISSRTQLVALAFKAQMQDRFEMADGGSR